MEKLCKYCQISKTENDFDKNRNKCKDCRKIDLVKYKKKYMVVNSVRIKENNKKYYKENKEKVDEYNITYYYNNLEKCRASSKLYRQSNKSKLQSYKKEKSKNDLNFKISNSIRGRISSAIRRNKNLKKCNSLLLLGCSIQEVRDYLESKFLPTMSWDNYGSYWHIDHIIPCSKFDLSQEEEQKKCFHYSNLQPLFALTQIIDGVKYLGNLNKTNKF